MNKAKILEKQDRANDRFVLLNLKDQTVTRLITQEASTFANFAHKTNDVNLPLKIHLSERAVGVDWAHLEQLCFSLKNFFVTHKKSEHNEGRSQGTKAQRTKGPKVKVQITMVRLGPEKEQAEIESATAN